MDTDKTAIAPQVYQISDASRLRKSSCNYLRSAVSVSLELLALIVADGIRIFTYSEGSGNIIDSFLRTIRLPPGDLIRDIAWAPPGYCVAREGGANTLAICFEDRLELWISKEKSFALHETYFYGKTIVGILHIIWNEDFLNEIFICTSLLIHKVLLLSLPPSPDVNADVKNTQLQPLPSLNTRHPGGIALSSGTFVTGNAYREAVGAFGFTGCGGGDASQKQRRHVVMERCRAPLSLTPQEAQQCEQIRYHPSATTTISNEYLRNGSSLCILAFEPEARISSPVSSDLLAPSVGAGGGEISLCTGSSGPPFPSSLISVVSSTPSMTVVDEANDGTVGEGSLLSALKSKATDNEGKSRGAFPHSTFSTSIAETLRVGDRDAGDGKSFAYQGPSALEALQSLSSHISCNDSDRMLHESCLLKGEEGSISETKPVNLMATGILCAVRLRRESHVEDKGSIDGPSVQLGATAAASPRPKEMAWLGSTLSLPKSRASARTGAILRPDILAIHPLMSDSHSQSSADGATVALLAVSSTLSDQIIVYRVHMNEEEDKAQFHEVHFFSFPEEGRCRGLCFLPMRGGVVLMALAAKPKEHSVASHSTSATYETSVITYKIRIDSTSFKHVEIVETISSSSKEDGGKDDAEFLSATHTRNNSTIVEFLSQMKDSFDHRMDRLERVISQQGNKIDHLQACLDKLNVKS